MAWIGVMCGEGGVVYGALMALYEIYRIGKG